MAENTRMKDIQADVKCVTKVSTNHSTQFLKVDQTFKVMHTLLRGHTERFVKVEKTPNSILSMLHQCGEATTSRSLRSDESNVASRRLFWCCSLNLT
ncbi:hypothetical protein ACSQ67_020951 [Phaseolus vulgaris]